MWDKAIGTTGQHTIINPYAALTDNTASNSFYPEVTKLTNLLIHKLEEHDNEPVRVNDWSKPTSAWTIVLAHVIQCTSLPLM